MQLCLTQLLIDDADCAVRGRTRVDHCGVVLLLNFLIHQIGDIHLISVDHLLSAFIRLYDDMLYCLDIGNRDFSNTGSRIDGYIIITAFVLRVTDLDMTHSAYVSGTTITHPLFYDNIHTRIFYARLCRFQKADRQHAVKGVP